MFFNHFIKCISSYTIKIYNFKTGALIFPLVVVATDLTVRLLVKELPKRLFFIVSSAIVSSILVVFFGNFFSVAVRIVSQAQRLMP